MKHIRTISAPLAKAQDIPISVLLQFITAVLTAIIALFTAKESDTTP